MTNNQIIRQIKARVPKAGSVALDGVCRYDGDTYLWWAVERDGAFLWIDYESSALGRVMELADNYDTELLANILGCMPEA